jgi:hypothetical protein
MAAGWSNRPRGASQTRCLPGHPCDVSSVPWASSQSSSESLFRIAAVWVFSCRRLLPGGGLQYRRPHRVLGICRRPALDYSARISCGRKLFSCCCGILEIRSDQRRELTSSAKTICRRRFDRAEKITAKPRSRIRNATLRGQFPSWRKRCAAIVNAHPESLWPFG